MQTTKSRRTFLSNLPAMLHHDRPFRMRAAFDRPAVGLPEFAETAETFRTTDRVGRDLGAVHPATGGRAEQIEDGGGRYLRRRTI